MVYVVSYYSTRRKVRESWRADSKSEAHALFEALQARKYDPTIFTLRQYRETREADPRWPEITEI